MPNLEIELNPNIKTALKIAYLQFSKLKCQAKKEELWQDMENLGKSYREKYHSPSDALNELRPARNLYRAVGIEPTRIRPSSEALLRRVIKSVPLYQINSIVDVSNYCSLAFLLPIGLYDLDKIRGRVQLRLGKEGEEYEGIRKDMIHVANRLTVADDTGPFGNPSADSLRTSIDLNSHNILLIIFTPHNYPADKLQKHSNFAEEVMLKYHPSGELVKSGLLG
jgi:DNA/RNA-binding domain of Phe-tRNA-synthetase-like protein